MKPLIASSPITAINFVNKALSDDVTRTINDTYMYVNNSSVKNLRGYASGCGF